MIEKGVSERIPFFYVIRPQLYSSGKILFGKDPERITCAKQNPKSGVVMFFVNKILTKNIWNKRIKVISLYPKTNNYG